MPPPSPLSQPCLLSTFDCEEWWHVLPSPFPSLASRSALFEHSQALTISFAEHCARRRHPCLFFVLGETAQRSPQLLRYLTELGFEIGSHSMSHPDLHMLDRASLRRELIDSKALLEDIIGSPVHAFRAPNFSIDKDNLWALDEIQEAGYTLDCSILLRRSPKPPALIRHLCPSGELLLLPGFRSTFLNIPFRFPGGGFLRLLPLGMLHRELARHPFHVSYVHASDFDRFRPRIPGDHLLQHIKRRIGNRTTHHKIFELLDHSQVLSSTDYIHRAIQDGAVASTELASLGALL